MSAASYDILKELGALVIWVSKGFRENYSSCKQNKYAFEVGLGVVILVIFIFFITGW